MDINSIFNCLNIKKQKFKESSYIAGELRYLLIKYFERLSEINNLTCVIGPKG